MTDRDYEFTSYVEMLVKPSNEAILVNIETGEVQ